MQNFIVSDSVEGAFGAGPLTCIPLVLAELSVRDGAGVFDVGLPAHIPNRVNDKSGKIFFLNKA
jgi:hypothetical protein